MAYTVTLWAHGNVISYAKVETVEQAKLHVLTDGLPATMTLAEAFERLDEITETGQGLVYLPDGAVIEVRRA